MALEGGIACGARATTCTTSLWLLGSCAPAKTTAGCCQQLLEGTGQMEVSRAYRTMWAGVYAQ